MVIPAEQAVWKQPSYAILWVNAKRLPPAMWRKPYVMRRYRPARRQADRWKVDGLDDIAPVLLRLAQVALVAALGTLLRLGEELIGLILERLLQ